MAKRGGEREKIPSKWGPVGEASGGRGSAWAMFRSLSISSWLAVRFVGRDETPLPPLTSAFFSSGPTSHPLLATLPSCPCLTSVNE